MLVWVIVKEACPASLQVPEMKMFRARSRPTGPANSRVIGMRRETSSLQIHVQEGNGLPSGRTCRLLYSILVKEAQLALRGKI